MKTCLKIMPLEVTSNLVAVLTSDMEATLALFTENPEILCVNRASKREQFFKFLFV